ncbi:MAG: phosphoadenylyl-sulfate reductase [Myxococcota bacterium]
MVEIVSQQGSPVPDPVLAEVRAGLLEKASAEEILEWGMDRFAPRMALSSSFGSPEGLVILDLMHRIDPSRTRVFTIDTGRLYQQTYDLIDRVRDRYQIEVEVFFPDPARVQAMVRERGLNLFYESVDARRLCCHVRKGEPLERALQDLDAWISGLRSGQGVTREQVPAVEIDSIHGDRIKLNPLATWSPEQVWSYVHQHRVPVNALHRQGYPSVGCAPCTRAIEEGEDERAGRWWWENPETRECGIHTGYEDQGSGI